MQCKQYKFDSKQYPNKLEDLITQQKHGNMAIMILRGAM